MRRLCTASIAAGRAGARREATAARNTKVAFRWEHTGNNSITPAGRSCTAVGSRASAAGRQSLLAEHWNGASWAIERTPAAGAS